jgi:hypothetical protein
MGIEAHGLDLHSGFNILKAAHSRSSAQAVRFGVIAPAVSLHSDDLSRCASDWCNFYRDHKSGRVYSGNARRIEGSSLDGRRDDVSISLVIKGALVVVASLQ